MNGKPDAPGMRRVHIYLTDAQLKWIELRANGVRSRSSVIREVLNRMMDVMPMQD